MKLAILAALFLVACSSSGAPGSSPAVVAQDAGGNEGPNGGNFEAQDIARLSGELVQIVKTAATTFPEIDPAKLDATVTSTKLYVVPSIIVNGKDLDASNNGVDTIWINYLHWRLQTDHMTKIALLFHEYLGVMGIEKNTYNVSQRLLNPLNNMSTYTTYDCSKSFYMKIRYDIFSDRFLMSYLQVAPEVYPNAIRECHVDAPSLSDADCAGIAQQSVRNANSTYWRYVLSAPDVIFQRDGDKIHFENDTSPNAHWTNMMIHDDRSITFVTLTGDITNCEIVTGGDNAPPPVDR